MGKIERAIEAAMWDQAIFIENWGRPYRIYRTAWDLATIAYQIDTDVDEPTAAQMKAVYRAMHSLARKSPCFRLEGGKDDVLHLTYKLAPPSKKKRKPGGGRKPNPPIDWKEITRQQIAFYKHFRETGR